ncbi:HAT2 [Hepatospora eriocheir]|uniref:HAT2 n=1 Tax=Hepatospora eriocheir TaxID=1081669 RepID=A0A1X0QH04_9MICR|nr:HAT2 [Hepatospora eriocheir]
MAKEELNNLIEEEFKIWKVNIPYLYDLVFTSALEWPSPTVQWFPDLQRHTNNTVSQKILLTTYTGGSGEEKLIISNIKFPDTVKNESLVSGNISLNVQQTIPVFDNEINRARFCPQSPSIVACKTESADLLIYDTSKHPYDDPVGKPNGVLKGHQDGGYAVSWNTKEFGELISGGRDKRVCVFNINNGLVNTYNEIHSSIVNDLCFSCFNPKVFISGAEDGSIRIVDMRNSEHTSLISSAHSGTIECVDFSPFKAELFASGSSDKSIKIWDTRSLKEPLVTLCGHVDDVLSVKWSPHYESILGTSSKDRRVNIWDLNKSDEQVENESQELLFIHGGHTSTVGDFSWNPCEPMEICSVADDNILHVWKIPVNDYI